MSLSTCIQPIINWWNGLTSERYRRFFLRLTSTLLIVLVGPTMAWNAGKLDLFTPLGPFTSLQGILSYIFIHTISKLVISNFSKSNMVIANFAYRYAALLQAIACIGCFVVVHEGLHLSRMTIAIYSAIVLPTLLGGYEGAYWASYHGINTAAQEIQRLEKLAYPERFEETKDKEATLTTDHYNTLTNIPMDLEYEIVLEATPGAPPPPDSDQEDKYTSNFQLNEVLATVTIAFSVFFASEQFPDSWEMVAFVLAGIVLCFALFWPFDKKFKDSNGQPIRRDRSPLPNDKGNRSRGKTITGNFGVMQLTVNWAMKIFALKYGGIVTLSLYVALAELTGFVLAEVPKWVTKKTDEDEKERGLNKNPLYNAKISWNEKVLIYFKQNKNIWLLGHIITISGILIMSWGAIVESSNIFLIGWLFSQGAVRGMMRGREIYFANLHLKPIPPVNCEIGVRERSKFSLQFLYVFVLLGCYFLHTFISISPVLWTISILLFWAAFTALMGLALYFPGITGTDFLTRQQDSQMD